MCKLLILLALIGPILPTPVPLTTFAGFHADALAPHVALVTWQGTGGFYLMCVGDVCSPRRWAAGTNAVEVKAGTGDVVSLRDGQRVLARASVVGRVWLPDVRRAP